MIKLKHTLLACISALFLISCQKELTMDSSLGVGSGQGGTTNNLQGNWKFLGMYSQTQAVVELNDGVDVLKTVTLSEYNTKKNTGTLVIDASKMTATNFGYEVDTLAKGFVYDNNVLVDSMLVPFNFVLPPSNSVAPYTKVSSDSITMGPGQFLSMGGSAPLTQPTGVKIKYQGDKLLMTINVSVTDVQSVFGITQTKKEAAKVVLTYQKQ